MFRNLVLCTVALSSVLLGVCTAQGAPDNAAKSAETQSADNLASKTPSIHLEQTAVQKSHGRPTIQRNYQHQAADCEKGQAESGITFVPLAPGDIKKLGRTYFDVWYHGAKVSTRADTWGYKSPPDKLCTFEVTHKIQLWLSRPGLEHARHQTGHDANARIVYTSGARVSRPKAPHTASDDKMKAEVLKRVRQKGYGNLLDHKEGEQSVAGHPCTVATGPSMKVCAWTKGRKWGLDMPSNIAPGANAEGASPYGSNMINLWEKPADGGDGFYLTTQTFTIGKPLDPNVFERKRP